MKTSKERLDKVLGIYGLEFVNPVEDAMKRAEGNDPPAEFNHVKGELTVNLEHEDSELVQCLIRTLESAEEIEQQVEELTSPPEKVTTSEKE